MRELSFQAHEPRLLQLGDADIGLGEYGNDVTWLEQKILRRISIKNRFSQVERQELGTQVGLVQPLDHRVVPVDLVKQILDLRTQAVLSFAPRQSALLLRAGLRVCTRLLRIRAELLLLRQNASLLWPPCAILLLRVHSRLLRICPRLLRLPVSPGFTGRFYTGRKISLQVIVAAN